MAPVRGSCTRAASRSRACGPRQGVLHTGRTRTANPCPPLGGGLAPGPANHACLPVAASSGLARGYPCPPLGGLAHGPANERTTTHDDEKMLRAHKGTKPETSIDGVRQNGTSPRQRGRLLPPPMRAWLTQPHGRQHKAAPPQPCALTTKLLFLTQKCTNRAQKHAKIPPKPTKGPGVGLRCSGGAF